MASPQTENGYTPIANELLEAIYSQEFNATQLKIILMMMRYTYGFSRKSHQLSVSFLSKGINLSSRFITSELNNLISRNIVIVIKDRIGTRSRVMGINKNYKDWQDKNLLLNNRSPEQSFMSTTEQSFTSTTEVSFTQDKQKTKNNKAVSPKPKSESIHKQIVDYLNEKNGSDFRHTTDKTKRCINARLKEKYTFDDFKKVIDKKVLQWKNTDMAKYLRPETLFGTKFEGYLNEIDNTYKKPEPRKEVEIIRMGKDEYDSQFE